MSQPHPSQTASCWDGLAPNYESLILPQYIRKVIPVMINDHLLKDHATTAAGCKILDIGTGTGFVCLELLTKSCVAAMATIEANDVAPKMLELAKQNFAKLLNDEQRARINLTQQDAQALNFADNYFDAATASFVYMFVPDRNKGFSELLRVLKKGAKYVLLQYLYYSCVAA